VYTLHHLSVTDFLEAFTEGVRVRLHENEQIRLVEDEMLNQHSFPAHCRATDHQWVERLRLIRSQFCLQDTLRFFSISCTLLTHDRRRSSHASSIVIY